MNGEMYEIVRDYADSHAKILARLSEQGGVQEANPLVLMAVSMVAAQNVINFMQVLQVAEFLDEETLDQVMEYVGKQHELQQFLASRPDIEQPFEWNI